MSLEDEFGDIISKAWDGLGVNIEQVSSATGINAEKLLGFANYTLRPTEQEVKKLASLLNLNFNALLNIANNDYYPKEFDYNKFYDGIQIIPIKGSIGGYGVYAYIITSRNNECVIIDTAGSPELIINEINKNNLKPLFALLTHSHSDHIGGIRKIKNDFKIEGYIFKSKLFESENLCSLKDSQSFDFNGHKIKAIYTPGHTQDSATFSVGKFLFVGDLIFAGSLGRANWSYDEILSSAKKVLDFPEGCHIFPGHGPKTSIEEQRRNNAFVIFR